MLYDPGFTNFGKVFLNIDFGMSGTIAIWHWVIQFLQVYPQSEDFDCASSN